MDTAEYRLVHSVEASVDDTKALKDSFTGADQCHAKDTFKYKDKPSRFQRCNLTDLACYLLVCAIAYPFLYLITLLAGGRSLFTARLLVGLGCAIVALSLGFFLQELEIRFLEVATWTTIIQQSLGDISEGMTLSELSAASQPHNPFSFFWLWRAQRRSRSGNGGPSPWRKPQRTVYASYVSFLLLISLTAALSFILGRIVDISTGMTFDGSHCVEVPIFGDLLENERVREDGETFESYYRQMAIPSSWTYDAPSHIQFDLNGNVSGEEHQVYLTEPYATQLRVDGTAIGAANLTRKWKILAEGSEKMVGIKFGVSLIENMEMAKGVSLLRYPQWGVRTSCERFPNMEENVATGENSTRIVLPRKFVSGLHSSLNLTFDEGSFVDIPDLSVSGSSGILYYFPFVMLGDNASQDALTTLVIDWSSQPYEYLVGPENFLASYVTDKGESGEGFTVFDIFLTQLYSHAECSGESVSTQCVQQPGLSAFEFHEAIACVQRTEPWILEVLNTTRAPAAMGVLGRGGNVSNFESQNKSLVHTIESEDGHNYVHNLNSTKKFDYFLQRYAVSSFSWTADVVSRRMNDFFTTNPWDQMQEESGRLSVSLFERFRGATSARTLLPQMAGSGKVAAHRYYPKQIAYARIHPVPMATVLTIVCLAGIAGSLCVPTLPDGFPERRFDVYSWIASVKGDGLTVENVNIGKEGRFVAQEVAWRPKMTVEEVEKQFGSARVRYRLTKQ